jgi:hypothetical protein
MLRWNPDVHPVVRWSLVTQDVGPAGFSDLEARWELFKATQIRPTFAAYEETIANVSRVRPVRLVVPVEAMPRRVIDRHQSIIRDRHSVFPSRRSGAPIVSPISAALWLLCAHMKTCLMRKPATASRLLSVKRVGSRRAVWDVLDWLVLVVPGLHPWVRSCLRPHLEPGHQQYSL